MKLLKKIILYTIIFSVFIYLGIYLALPFILNKKDYSKIITETLQKQTGLILIVHNYKLSMSPTLAVNLKAQDVQLFYPDKKQIMNVKNADFNLSTLYLLKKEIKINKAKADELQFSTKLLKNGKTTFQQYLEKNVKEIPSDFGFSKELPKISVKKYILKIKDEESGQKFKINGKDFKVVQNTNFNYLNFQTNGNIYCFDKKYVSYNLKLAVPKVLFKDVKNTLFDLSLDNLHKYSFHADLDADLKINAIKDKFESINGKVNIDNFTMNIGTATLPPSYFHIVLDKGYASLISKFYTDYNESTDISAKIKTAKPYDIDMKCNCKKADIKNLQQLAVSVCNLLKIKNNLNEFSANGQISSDFTVKTDFKKLVSNGSLKIINANISHKNVPLKITGINGLIDFSNNSIKIKKSDVLINNQPLKISGTIDPNANGNIIVSADNLDLNHIMNAFPALKPQKNLIINSGKLSFSTKIEGNLTKAEPQINAVVKNFNAQETVNKIKVSVREILIDAKTSKNKYSGIVTFNGIIASAKAIPNNTNSIRADIISAKFDTDNLTINPSKINMGNAKLTLSGMVKNYATKPYSEFLLSGTADTALIKSFAPPNTILYSKGYLPLKVLIKADEKTANASIVLLANPNNYITPIHINNFKNTNTLTQIKLKSGENNLDIDELAVYYAPNINSLVKEINVSGLKKAIDVKGKILNINTKQPFAQNLRVVVPENLNIDIPLSLPNLKNARTNFITDLTLNGTPESPDINGTINLSNLEIPQYFVKAQSAEIKLNKSFINAKIDNLKIKSMDLSIEAVAPSNALMTNHINYLRINAGYIDMDYLMSLMPLLAQSTYSPGIEFPYTISSGKLNVKSFKMGEIKAQNITADISAEKNILFLKNLFATVYGGKTGGRITYNFPYSSIQAEIQGRGLDAASAAKDFMPQGQQISGRLNFDSTISMFGTDAKQQMKTLKGSADILINNGQLGPLGRFEHFLYAQNLLSQRLIYANLNSAKQAIKPKNTGYVTYLKGVLKLNNGYIYLNPVQTSGPQMSMYITGNINLLNNNADMQILGKVSSEVSGSMGILGSLTIKEFLDEHTKYGAAAASLFNFCNSEIPELDISKIPSLTPDYRYATKNFRVLIEGDTESVKAVKSFTWVNPIGTKQQVSQQKNNTQQTQPTHPQENTTQAKTAEPATQTQPVVQSRPMVKPTQNQPDFLDNIPDSFK